MASRLDKALSVFSTDETVRISVRWPDPLQAYHIVEGALQNFMEARQIQEITAIDEAIALLQSRLATLRLQLDREEAERDDSPRRDMVAPAEAGTSVRPLPAGGNAELARVRSLLDAKERAIRDVDDFRRRRLLDLQAQLAEKRSIYAEAHPVIIGLRKEIDSLSGESVVANLRAPGAGVAAARGLRRTAGSRCSRAGQSAIVCGKTHPGPSRHRGHSGRPSEGSPAHSTFTS